MIKSSAFVGKKNITKEEEFTTELHGGKRSFTEFLIRKSGKSFLFAFITTKFK